LYEGGIRVPLIVRYPGVVPAGSLCSEPVVSTDFFPTLLALGGMKPDRNTPLDGESLVPLLTAKGALTRDAIFFHYPNYAFHGGNRLGSAIRSGDFKLIENFDDGSLELYNLADDLSETRNLAEDMPQRTRSMAQRLSNWRNEVNAAIPEPKKQ
jgi:arylsulfatase A-like enzyme